MENTPSIITLLMIDAVTTDWRNVHQVYFNPATSTLIYLYLYRLSLSIQASKTKKGRRLQLDSDDVLYSWSLINLSMREKGVYTL